MNSKDELKKMHFETKAIHGGYEKNKYGALATPIYQTSTFIFDSAAQGGRRFALEEGYIYSRLGNPTNTQVEQKVALLEEGEDCVSAASGMGAITSAIWPFISCGDHLVAAKTLYGCTFAYLEHAVTRMGVDVEFVDITNVDNIVNAVKENTKIVYLETPANPNMDICDIELAAKRVHEKNKDTLVIVDNTYCTPYIQKPLTLGADIVVHSATKYLNGHGDVIAGFAVGRKELMDQVRLVGIKDCTGAVLAPFNAYLILRGMKTLQIRMDKHCSNAQKVAEFLEGHPKVKEVKYPGLKSFKYYDIAKKQMALPGAMIAFEIEGGKEAGEKLMDSVKLCTLAVSLGDAETLIQHPASMTHSPYTPEERAAAGISEGLIRLSVGLENAEDIIEDLKQAFEQI